MRSEKNLSAAPSAVAHADKVKSLIVFFSRKGQNYPKVNLTIGYTQVIAQYIRDRVDADVFEVVPQDPYPEDYDAVVRRNQREEDADARPAIVGPLPDVSEYQSIFIGYPTWNMQMPMVMRTFLDSANLNGKTIIPFNTNAGYGVGSSVEVIRRQWPNASVLQEFEVNGADAAQSRKAVNRWLEKIGY
ncbi:MAG: hypothetical protein LKJ44_03000 [Bifidobacteriaceae bacterium]|jgi:flavodoxin|nr:hypothetical protein [Bifidobacteriaceae bacterium]MCI1978669.1 hypothetical protein [Bifidobacteriaceae bacterium]